MTDFDVGWMETKEKQLLTCEFLFMSKQKVQKRNKETISLTNQTLGFFSRQTVEKNERKSYYKESTQRKLNNPRSE